MLTILWFLLALGILVTIHEFGHFYVARRCHVKVLRFSIGFGKPLYTWCDNTGTEFTLASIPLGGYVKMLDQRDGDVAESEIPFSFNAKSVWQRMAIVLAGPLANFLLAIFLYFILALMGKTGIAPVVGEVSVNKPAAMAGLQQGDEITAVDGNTVVTWGNVFSHLIKRIGDTGQLELTVKPSEGGNISKMVNIPISQWLGDTDQPDVLASLGMTTYVPDGQAVVDRVSPGSAAAKAGLEAGDRIIRADEVVLNGWRQWVKYVQERPETRIMLQIERQGQLLETVIIPDAKEIDGKVIGRVGVSAAISWPEHMIRPVEYTVIESVQQGFIRTWEQAGFITLFIKKLLFAEVSVKNLGGSVTIAKAAGDSAKAGIASYIAFIAFLSVSLGVFNLLPIPVLDGGHFLYFVIEAIKGSPVSESVQVMGYQLGLVLVVGVMVVAHINDLVRLLS